MKFIILLKTLIILAPFSLKFCVGMENEQKKPRIIYLREPTVHQISPGKFRNFVIENTSEHEWKTDCSSSRGNSNNNNDNNDDDVVLLGSRSAAAGPVILDFSNGKTNWRKNCEPINQRKLKKTSDFLSMTYHPTNNSDHINLQAMTNFPADQAKMTNESHGSKDMSNPTNNSDQQIGQMNLPNTANATDQLTVEGTVLDQREKFGFSMPNQQNHGKAVHEQFNSEQIFGRQLEEMAMPKTKKRNGLPEWLCHSIDQQTEEKAESSNKQPTNYDQSKFPVFINQCNSSDQQNIQTTTNLNSFGTLNPAIGNNNWQTDQLDLSMSSVAPVFDQQNFSQISSLDFPAAQPNQFNIFTSDQFRMTNQINQTEMTNVANHSTNFIKFPFSIPNPTNGQPAVPQQQLPEWHYPQNIGQQTENAEIPYKQRNYFDQTDQQAMASHVVDQNFMAQRMNSFGLINSTTNSFDHQIYGTDQQQQKAIEVPSENAELNDQQQPIAHIRHRKVPTMSSITTEMPADQQQELFAVNHLTHISNESNSRGHKRPFEDASKSSSVNNQIYSDNELVSVIRHLFELSLTAIGILPHYIEKPLALVVEGAPMENPLVRHQFEILTKILRQMDAKIVEERIKEQMFKDEIVKNDNLLRHIFKKIQKQVEDMFGHKLFQNEENGTETTKSDGKAEILFFFMHLYNKMAKILKNEHYEKNKNAEELRVALHKWVKSAKERVSTEFQQIFKKNISAGAQGEGAEYFGN